MNHTYITTVWLQRYWDKIKDMKSVNELKKFVWETCQPYITKKDMFIKGQRLVNYNQIFRSIENERGYCYINIL